jgi:Tetratricopeptide repeat/Cytochrome c554 and c-prime
MGISPKFGLGMRCRARERGSSSNRIGLDQESGHIGQPSVPNAYSSLRVRPAVIVVALFVAIASGALCCILHPLCLEAQGNDAIVTESSRKQFTIGDELPRGPERDAFIQLYQKLDPHKQAQLAEAFLNNYPASRVLAQVYEIAAKAQIRLGNYDNALKYAIKSLEIYPENMSLLVPLANAEAQMGLNDEAEHTARDALEYLHRFDGPSAMAKREWAHIRDQMIASCYFVLARVQVVQGLNATRQTKGTALLKQSLVLLAKAKGLNPKDPEIYYLMGLSQLSLGQKGAAAISFAKAARSQDPVMRPNALKKLHALYLTSGLSREMGFQSYIRKLNAQREPNPQLHPPSQDENKIQLPAYAGSQACRLCHADIYKNWSRTGMGRMFRPYDPQNVIGDFKHDDAFYMGDEVRLKRNGELEIIPGKKRKLFARMITIRGRPFFKIRESNGLWHLYRVDYTIGSKWQQAYATRLPSGEIHVFPIEYTAIHKRWINFWKITDVPGTERSNPANWGKLDISTNYKVQCAICHTSQLRNTEGGGFTARGLKFREPGIDCEMCHGPSAQHVASMKKGKLYSKPPIEPPVDFRKISAKQFLEICSQCHMESAIRKPAPDGELNYSRTGPDFFMHYKNVPYDEFYWDGVYKDGRFEQTTFIVESLMRSKCYRVGHVTCGNCHDPHLPNYGSNPDSLKVEYLHHPNRMCTQCHVQYKSKAQVERHTHHAFASKASQCVSCHMPRIMYSLMFWARAHRIDNIPNPQMTLRFGERASPNACLLCHTRKDAHWVAARLTAWRSLQ